MGKGDWSQAAKKQLSKALRRGGGVKTLPGKRTPSGQLSRAKDARPRERVEKAPAVRARMRDYKLTEEQAVSQYGGTGHGRAYLNNIISSEGYQVADWYCALRQGWKAVQACGPKEPASAALPYVSMHHGVEDVEAARRRLGRAVECPEERARKIIDKWNMIQAALMQRNGLVGALNDVVLDGVDVSGPNGKQRRKQLLRALEAIAPLWNVAPFDVHPQKSC